MLFDDVENTTQKLVIDSSGIDITTQAGAVTTLRDGKVGIGTSTAGVLLDITTDNTTSSNDDTLFKIINIDSSRTNNLTLLEFIHRATGHGELHIPRGSTSSDVNNAIKLNAYGASWFNGKAPNQGILGIGTNSPEYHLEVSGSTSAHTNNISGSFRWYRRDETTHTTNGDLGGISIKASNAVWAPSFFANSDSRIKRDICEANDASALNLVNQIECKEYNYIDPLMRKSYKTVGYIAQEVNAIYPNAVTLQNNIIPDELRVIDNLEWNTLEDKYSITIPDLDLSSNNTGKCRFYISNDPSGNDEVMREVTVEPDNKTFIFDESWNNVFFYGKEVNDFHTVDKNKIFQLHHPAIQQLSKMNDEKTAQIAALQQENVTMQGKIANLEARLLALESK